MKNNIITAIRLTLVSMLVLIVAYPVLINFIGKLSPGKGEGEKLMKVNRVVGYAMEGQLFSSNNYFWGRPSAVAYNAAGSGGSNKGTSNPDYLLDVKGRLDAFIKAHRLADASLVPSEMITASGSGLDPDISPAAARIQVERVASARKMDVDRLRKLVDDHIGKPFLGLFGTERVNVLRLNIALDELK